MARDNEHQFTTRNEAPNKHAHRTLFTFAVLLFVAAGVCFTTNPLASGQSASADRPSKQIDSKSALTTSPEPTGAQRCVVCHPSEVAGYEKTTMAHSLRRAGIEPAGTVSANGSTITATLSAAGTFQHWANGGDQLDFRVDWVIGSGTHASGYLVNIGDHLFQSPIAFYHSRNAYDLAPGFENQSDPDFTRPIREECVLCHSGTALHVAETLNQYRAPIFPADAESITCERCHGPSEQHVANPSANNIIRPAKLEPAARDSICEQCHLFGAARVPNPGKKISDFVPGQRTEDVFTTYHDANPTGAFKVISHSEQLALSACARNSGDKLWCGTCHNPHDKPVEAVSYYRARCLTCHATNFPAAHPAKDSDCLSCHMPRRNANDGGHTVFTDHRIQRRPQEAPAAPADSGIVAWREPAPEFQMRNLGIAHIDAGMQRHSAPFILQGYRELTSVQQQFSSDSELYKWIGQALLIGKQDSEAKFAFERALELDPNSALAEADAASPYIESGDSAGAIAHLESALAIDPLDLPAASSLIALYRKDGRYPDANALSEKIKTAMEASSAPATGASAKNGGAASPTAQSAFKNIQVLKEIPASELIPTMQFISSALGVECSYCHLEGHFEKDDKKPKQTARGMMWMMFELNKSDFAGSREITCYSCHRGSAHPVSTPDLAEKAAPPAVNEIDMAKLAADLPAPSRIVADYVTALGGSAALEKITSRVTQGNETAGGRTIPIEISVQSPDKRSVVRRLPNGEATEVLNGTTGWSTAPGRPARELTEPDEAAAAIDANLQFPLHIWEKFADLHSEYGEAIDGRPAFVLAGTSGTSLRVNLYFDCDSHLLVREVRFGESALGLNPTQIDYSDYRDVDGVQVPFRITTTQPRRTSTFQAEEVHQNGPIDDTIFAPPPAALASNPGKSAGRPGGGSKNR
jgi:photosynthetic reaction center cytochrome c subunit